MRICVLGSGSTGNCTYIGTGGTHVLVDAGLTYKATVDGLKGLGVSPESLSGILLTHDHTDHCKSADAMRRRHGVDLYANECTAAAVEVSAGRDGIEWSIFENGAEFAVGTFRVEAFQVPHDAADTVGFVISAGGVRLGVVTDLGTATSLVRSRLRDCDVLILETNHDPDMLRQAQRHESVKRRALGRSGHLSNDDAAELLESALSPRLRAVFMAHLSLEGNTPTLAENALRKVLRNAGRDDVRILQTHPTTMSALLELT